MSSRSSAGAIVFVVALVGIGLFAAYRAEQKASDAESSAAVPAGDEASSAAGTQPAPADAPTTATSEPADKSANGSGGEPAPATDAASGASGAAPAAQDAAAADAEKPGSGDTASGGEADAPAYDLVRVEPTGDAVVAGRASPGATVELEVNGEVVASTVANENGEWVIVLDKPLAPGDYDISLRSKQVGDAASKTSSDRLAVSIPANRSETPLVALSRPNAPVEVLQKPAATITSPETQVASAYTPKSASGVETAASAAAGKSDRVSTASGTAPAAPSEGATPAPAGTVPADGAKPDTAPQATGGERPAGAAEAVTSEGAGSTSAASPSAGSGTETGTNSDAAAGTRSAAPTGPAASDADASKAAAPATPAVRDDVPVTIEIAEAAGDTFRLQGRSKPGADNWIYLAGEYIGEAKASDAGRWSFEAKMAFEAGDYSIRVDQVANRAGAVATRAEVPFAFKRAGNALAEVAGGTDGGPKVSVLDETEEGVRVLIRRGDNLWTIAHHFYGDGFSYSNIYRENNGQIRNPHLIYPGQVFLLPGLTKKDITDAQKDRAL